MLATTRRRRALAAWLQARPAPGVTRAVYAALADKDSRAVVEALHGQIGHWHLAGLSGPRGQSAAALAERVAGTPAAQGEQAEAVAQALAQALAQSNAGDRVLVFGSFHAVAEAMQALHSVH